MSVIWWIIGIIVIIGLILWLTKGGKGKSGSSQTPGGPTV